MGDRTRQLEARVRVLEERLQMLRLSRRVLMNLLALRERERGIEVKDLVRQNRRLQSKNSRYARALMSSYLLQNDARAEQENPLRP